MKKLLILAYDFPPYVSVGGLRPYAWYKYLKEYGVEPIVVTRQWGNKYGNELDYIAPSESKETIIEDTEYGTIIRTPYKPNLANRIMLKYGRKKFPLIRKMVTAWYEFMQFLFFVGPKSGLYRGANAYLKQNKVDAIIATGEPFVLFKYASALSGKYHIPWIADYRDTWTQSTNRQKTIFQKKWNKHFEYKYLSNVKKCITVSEYVQRQIIDNIDLKLDFTILPNGFNPESFVHANNIKQNSDVFGIAFAGTIDKWHPITSVFSQLERFINQNNIANVKLDFYGTNYNAEIEKIIIQDFPSLKNIVHVYPKLPNKELIEKELTYNVLLLFNDYAIAGTKIYDYLALHRQIIFCYTSDEQMNKAKELYYPLKNIDGISSCFQEDIIKRTNAGILVENEGQLMSVFQSLYNEFSSTGSIACHSCNIAPYSRKAQTKQLADIIKNNIR